MFPKVTEHGTTRYPGVSVNSHLLAFSGRVNRANGMHDLVTRGMPERRGVAAPCSRKRSTQPCSSQGGERRSALELVVYPGLERGRRELGLAQLVPGRRYRCQGSVETEVLADAQGRARLALDSRIDAELRGRARGMKRGQ